MINFVGKKNIFFIVSGAIILLGMIAFAIFGGLNLDLDFQGGTAIRMELGQDFNDEDVRKLVSDTIGGHTVAVQKAGTNKTEAYIKTVEIDTETRDKVVEAIKEKYSLDQNALLEANNVSASASTKLIIPAARHKTAVSLNRGGAGFNGNMCFLIMSRSVSFSSKSRSALRRAVPACRNPCSLCAGSGVCQS